MPPPLPLLLPLLLATTLNTASAQDPTTPVYSLHPDPNLNIKLDPNSAFTDNTGSRVLATYDAKDLNSYAIFGSIFPCEFPDDARLLQTSCFPGLMIRTCTIAQSYYDMDTMGWLMDDTAALNLLTADPWDPNSPPRNEEYCLSCCSNSRLENDIHEMWDLQCALGSDQKYIKISDETYCKEFRFLRNAYQNDKEILHCRLERIGDVWNPLTDGSDGKNYSKWKNPTVQLDGASCKRKDFSRNAMSMLRGYTLELWVEERSDGKSYWRTVHDCKVTVDEDRGPPTAEFPEGPGLSLTDPQANPGGKNLIYEKIIMRQADKCDLNPALTSAEMNKPSICIAYTYPVHFYVLLCLFAWISLCMALKYGRDDPCQICNKRLIFFRTRCFWCRYHGSAKPIPSVWANMVKEDRVKRGRFSDARVHDEEDVFHKVEHFYETGVRQILFGATVTEEKYNDDSFLLDGFHPEKKITKAGNMERLKLEAKVEQEQFDKKMRKKERKKQRKAEQRMHFPEEISSSSTVGDVDAIVAMAASGKKTKVGFANGDSTNSSDSEPRRVGFGADPSPEKKTKFRPSMNVTPERSALKPSTRKSERAKVGFAEPQDSSGSSSDSSSGSSSDEEMDFAAIDAIAEKAAGTAAARLGYVEEPEPAAPVPAAKKSKKKASFGDDSDMRVEDAEDAEVRAAPQTDAAVPSKKRSMSRWTKIANKIEQDTIVTYMTKLDAEPKNFQVLTRIGFMAKKEADHEISEDPLFAFHLYRSAAMSLQKAVNIRGLSDCIKDQEFPWKDLAESHLRAWMLCGVKGDRHHLDLAGKAWSHATKQLVNATDPECLVKYASVQQFLGNYSSAGHILGEILNSFPKYERSGQVALQAAIILKSLHNYKQAAAYLETVLKMGPPAPYTVMDLMYIMARIYDEWSKEDDTKEQTAHKAYMKVYMKLVKEGTIEKEVHFEDWTQDPVTWCGLAEKCCAAGHYILAADLFHEASVRYDEDNEDQPLAALWFEMAKCYCRSGRMTTAKQCLEKALKIDPRSQKMVTVWTEWEDPSDMFAKQLDLPASKFAKKLSELMPTR